MKRPQGVPSEAQSSEFTGAEVLGQKQRDSGRLISS